MDSPAMEIIQATLNGLRDSITFLQAANAGLQQELRTATGEIQILQQHCGIQFPPFKKLPSEIRRMVWQFACRTPQVHILNEFTTSTSRITSIANACREARAMVESMSLDYYTADHLSSSTHPRPTDPTGPMKFFYNSDLDTMWINREEHTVTLPQSFSYYCGKCRRERWNQKISCSEGCLSTGRYPSPGRVRRLALNSGAWCIPGELTVMGSMELVVTVQAVELLIVVGECQPYEGERDVSFRSPLCGPTRMFKSTAGFQYWDPVRLDSWAALEDALEEDMDTFKKERSFDRVESLKAGEATLEEMESEDWEHRWDLSAWKIPKVRFVEAYKPNRDWHRPVRDARFG